jgi:hypothetical protein
MIELNEAAEILRAKLNEGEMKEYEVIERMATFIVRDREAKEHMKDYAQARKLLGLRAK